MNEEGDSGGKLPPPFMQIQKDSLLYIYIIPHNHTFVNGI